MSKNNPNRLLTTAISLFQISLLIFPAHSFGFVHASANVCSSTKNESCVDTCRTYEDQVEAEVNKVCNGNSPSGVPSPGPSGDGNIGSATSSFGTFNACREQVTAKWGELVQHCEAIRLDLGAAQWDIITTAIYAGAAAACTSACVALSSGFGAIAAPALEGICTALDLTGLAVDLGATADLEALGGKYSDWWDKAMGSAATGSAFVGGVGSAVLTTQLSKASNAAGEKAAQKAAQQTARSTSIDLAESAAKKTAREAAQKAAEKAAEKAARKAALRGASKLTKGLSCVTAAVMIATAAMKGVAYSKNCGIAGSECTNVTNLFSNVDKQRFTVLGPAKTTLETKKVSGGNSISNFIASGPKGDTSAISGTPGGHSDTLSNQTTGAATALEQKLFNDPKFQDLNDALKKNLGTSLESLAESLKTQTPAAVIAAAAGDGLPPSMKDALLELDAAAKSGTLSDFGFSGTNATVSSSGGGGGSSGGSGTSQKFRSFGSAVGPGPASAPATPLTFEKKTETLVSAEGDIWHSDWNGSIFQIISQKLKTTTDRIDNIDWATPLNRALLGLPNSPNKGKK